MGKSNIFYNIKEIWVRQWEGFVVVVVFISSGDILICKQMNALRHSNSVWQNKCSTKAKVNETRHQH